LATENKKIFVLIYNIKMNRLKNANAYSRSGWCLPTVIYVTLATVSVLVRAISGRYGANLAILAGELFHALFWTAIMYWLCSRGYSVLSWFILLIPLILTAAFFVVIETGLLNAVGGAVPGADNTVTHNYVTYY